MDAAVNALEQGDDDDDDGSDTVAPVESEDALKDVEVDDGGGVGSGEQKSAIPAQDKGQGGLIPFPEPPPALSAEALMASHGLGAAFAALTSLGVNSLESYANVCDSNTAEELAETLELPVEDMKRLMAAMDQYRDQETSTQLQLQQQENDDNDENEEVTQQPPRYAQIQRVSSWKMGTADPPPEEKKEENQPEAAVTGRKQRLLSVAGTLDAEEQKVEVAAIAEKGSTTKWYTSSQLDYWMHRGDHPILAPRLDTLKGFRVVAAIAVG